jgi:hypothetical protein
MQPSIQQILRRFAPNSFYGLPSENAEQDEQNKQKQALLELQKHYPGNYELEEYYNSERMMVEYKLKFLTEQDEVWFKLKYDL